MERLPQGVYTTEFRAEAVKLVIEQKMSVAGAAKRLSLPKSSLYNWVCAAKAGELNELDKADTDISAIANIEQRTTNIVGGRHAHIRYDLPERGHQNTSNHTP